MSDLMLWMIFVASILILVASCSYGTPWNISPIPTPTAITEVSPLPSPPLPVSVPLPKVASDKGAIIGVIVGRDGTPLKEGVKVFLTPFYRHETGDWGVYILEPSQVPIVTLDAEGRFQLLDIKPGAYVLIVGTTPEMAVAVLGDDGQARVIEVKPGEVVNIGVQRVNLSSK